MVFAFPYFLTLFNQTSQEKTLKYPKETRIKTTRFKKTIMKTSNNISLKKRYLSHDKEKILNYTNMAGIVSFRVLKC